MDPNNPTPQPTPPVPTPVATPTVAPTPPAATPAVDPAPTTPTVPTAPAPAPVTANPKKATSALVFAILGLVLGITFVFGLLFCTIGLVLGTKRMNDDHGKAMAAVVIASIGLLVTFTIGTLTLLTAIAGFNRAAKEHSSSSYVVPATQSQYGIRVS